jgi:hypothetical protein
MCNHIVHRMPLWTSMLLAALLSVAATGPAAAQTAGKIACERAYDACSDECVHLGVITTRCFNRCKRSYQLCAVKQLVLPSKPSTLPAATPGPVPRSMDSIQ